MIVPKNYNLGYACINTILRKQNIFSSRTCRLSTIEKNGIEHAQKLALKNLEDLITILKWNVANKIFFMRISSDIFPFASHDKYKYSLDFASDLLEEIGKYANENGIRITMHPGQFNVLNSLKENVVKNCIEDLKLHCEILDRMNLGKNSVIIIHGGGVFNDKKESLIRLKQNLLLLPKNVRNRIVLENCEMAFCVEDLLPISEELNVPLVIDFHHDNIYPSSKPVEEFYDRIFEVWKIREIKPKVHISNSISGVTENDSKTKRRKHSDYIEFFYPAMLKIEFPIDVMLECKMKEQAVLLLQ